MFNQRKYEKGGKLELKFYSGYKGEETPRAVVIGICELKIDIIILRKRSIDKKSGNRFELFKCQIEGDVVEIKKFETGKWEICFSENK